MVGNQIREPLNLLSHVHGMPVHKNLFRLPAIGVHNVGSFVLMLSVTLEPNESVTVVESVELSLALSDSLMLTG